MLEVLNISKAFKGIKAVENLHFNLSSGEFFALLGPNGAGKTTTINMISTLLKPDAGSILLDGKDVYSNKRASKLKMGVVPQEIALYDELSAYQNLRFWGNLYGLSRSQLNKRIHYLLDWVGLSDRKNDLIRTYSGGMKRRINIAAALIHSPDLIIMDEPTVGIDPHSRTRIYELLDSLHVEGKTILYTTHYMEEAEKMSNRIGIIDHGQLIASGSLSELKKMSGIRETIQIKVRTSPSDFNIPDTIPFQFNADINTLICFSNNVQVETPLLVKNLSEAGAVIQQIEVQTINLENIFIQLTGKNLRD